MKGFERAKRIGSSVQKGVSELLRRDISDPRLAGATITGAKASRDLGVVYVYYIMSGDSRAIKAAAAGFRSAEGFIRRSLASMLKIKYMPVIRFRYDESFVYGTNIDNILRELGNSDVPGGMQPDKEE
ncbi:MAG: ribosome-binding factor A [Desulfococcus sp. 4484_241]|nr:MAG: ribosome-binding factor A [Desulfococcus sp. 4484_241]